MNNFQPKMTSSQIKMLIVLSSLFLLIGAGAIFRFDKGCGKGGYYQKRMSLLSLEVGQSGVKGNFFLGCGSILSGDLFYFMYLETDTGIKPFKINEVKFKNININFIADNEIPYIIITKDNSYDNIYFLEYWNRADIFIHKNSIKNNYNINLNDKT